MRHICVPINQIIIQLYMLCFILLSISVQSHSANYKEQLLQANKGFVDCCIDSIPLLVDLMYILVQNLRFSLDIS